MKKLLLIVVMIALFSSAFSIKIDPLLLSEFNKTTKSSSFTTMSLPTKEFLVLYQGEAPTGNILHKYKHFNVVLMEGTLSDVYTLAENPNVLFIYSPNHKFSFFGSAVVNNTTSPIGDTPEVFSKYKGDGITIAVVDVGVNWSIPQLNETKNKELSISFTGNNNSGDHATFIASQLVSIDNDYPGIVQNSKIVDVKVGEENAIDLQQLLAGLDYLMSTNASVVSLSLGSSAVGFGNRSEYLDLLFDEIFYGFNLEGKNTIFVVAAGNNGTEGNYTIAQPGSSMYAFTVGAIDENNNIATYSSKGPVENNMIKPDVCAPGNVKSFVASGALASGNGTSFATPWVAGAAAILKQIGINDPYEIESILMETATPKGSVWECGAGVINITKAIEVANSTYFIIAAVGSPNYLGYVTDEAQFTIIFYNKGTHNQTIAYNVTYYNGTVMTGENVSKVITIRNGSAAQLRVKITVPDLPPNESYGFIVTNTSLRLPFSWAKAKEINLNDLYTEVNGAYFYKINYSQFPNAPNLDFEVDSEGKYYSTIISSAPDYNGFATNDTSKKFVVYPIYPIQKEGDVVYNLLPFNVSFYEFKYNTTFSGSTYKLVGEGMVKFDSDDFSIVIENGTNKEAMNVSASTILMIKDNIIFIKEGSNKKVISLNPNLNVTISIPTGHKENYTLIGSKPILPGSTSKVDKFDEYFVYPNTTEGKIIYDSNNLLVVNPTYGLIVDVGPVIKNSLWEGNVKFTVDGRINGEYPVYLKLEGVAGIFSSNQTVILEKKVLFSDGIGNANFKIFVPNYVDKIYFCFNTTDNCKEVTTSTGTTTSKAFDASWIDKLVSAVARMLYIYTH